MSKFYTSLRLCCLLASAHFICTCAIGQPVLAYTNGISGFTNPVDIVAEPGSSRLFVVQQNGIISIVDGTTILSTPYLNIGSLLPTGGNERGLLSMAFHPDYVNNGYFFVYYNNTAGDVALARYNRDSENSSIADAGSGVVLLTISKPFDNHNGGKLNFGPDGNLYFGVGDGGSGNDPNSNAQNGMSLLGKMIRLNVNNFTTPPYYTIPADNPFISTPGIRDEIWALGVRNPWRWSFDRSNGDVWIADVGQGSWEEVNYLSAANASGANYGWRCFEGNHVNSAVPACTPAGGTYRAPIFEYGHNSATGGFSITGGYVYRGTAYPALNGYYITADYVSGNLWLVRPNGTYVLQDDLAANISSFGEDNNGELYAVSRSAGTLYRVQVTTVLPVTLVQFTGNAFTGYNELKWTTASEEGASKFIIEYCTNGNDYLPAGEVASQLSNNGGTYFFRHNINANTAVKYRLRIVDIDQKVRYSPAITLSSKSSRETRIYPTVITNNTLQVISGDNVDRIDIYTMEGKPVHTKTLNGLSGYFSVSLPSLNKGVYLVRTSGKSFHRTDKIVVQ